MKNGEDIEFWKKWCVFMKLHHNCQLNGGWYVRADIYAKFDCGSNELGYRSWIVVDREIFTKNGWKMTTFMFNGWLMIVIGK